MALNFGDGMLFGENSLFDNVEDSIIDISRASEAEFTFTPGVIQDTNVDDFVISTTAFGEDNKILGYKTSYRIFNSSGATDKFAFQIKNVTQGTTLGSYSVSIGNTGTVSGAKLWTTEQIAQGDTVTFNVTEGNLGTNQNGGVTASLGLGANDFNPEIIGDFYDFIFDEEGLLAFGNNVEFRAPIHLPHGAVISSAVVFGDDTDNEWELIRATLTGHTAGVMASGDYNTADTSISNATVDNTNYSYYMVTNLLKSNWLYGARVLYGHPGLLGQISFSLETIEKRDGIDGVN